MKPLSISKQPPLLLHNDRGIFKERRLIKYSSSFNSCCIVHALKEDSKQYEIDPEKAKEALKELDQKIQSISSREASSPKLKGTLRFFLSYIFFSLLILVVLLNFGRLTLFVYIKNYGNMTSILIFLCLNYGNSFMPCQNSQLTNM